MVRATPKKAADNDAGADNAPSPAIEKPKAKRMKKVQHKELTGDNCKDFLNSLDTTLTLCSRLEGNEALTSGALTKIDSAMKKLKKEHDRLKEASNGARFNVELKKLLPESLQSYADKVVLTSYTGDEYNGGNSLFADNLLSSYGDDLWEKYCKCFDRSPFGTKFNQHLEQLKFTIGDVEMSAATFIFWKNRFSFKVELESGEGGKVVDFQECECYAECLEHFGFPALNKELGIDNSQELIFAILKAASMVFVPPKKRKDMKSSIPKSIQLYEQWQKEELEKKAAKAAANKA